MKKKISAVFAASLVLLGAGFQNVYNLFPVASITASAEDEKITSGMCGENVSWDYDDETKTLSLKGSGETFDYESETELPWNEYKYRVKHISIEDGITRLGNYLFIACQEEELVIPASVEAIGEHTFFSNFSLASVSFPDGLEDIGPSSFYGCENLAEVYIPESVEYIRLLAFGKCESLEKIVINNPECKIYHYKNTISENTTIYGYSGSTAQAFAEEYERKVCFYRRLCPF